MLFTVNHSYRLFHWMRWLVCGGVLQRSNHQMHYVCVGFTIDWFRCASMDEYHKNKIWCLCVLCVWVRVCSKKCSISVSSTEKRRCRNYNFLFLLNFIIANVVHCWTVLYIWCISQTLTLHFKLFETFPMVTHSVGGIVRALYILFVYTRCFDGMCAILLHNVQCTCWNSSLSALHFFNRLSSMFRFYKTLSVRFNTIYVVIYNAIRLYAMGSFPLEREIDRIFKFIILPQKKTERTFYVSLYGWFDATDLCTERKRQTERECTWTIQEFIVFYFCIFYYYYYLRFGYETNTFLSYELKSFQTINECIDTYPKGICYLLVCFYRENRIKHRIKSKGNRDKRNSRNTRYFYTRKTK